MFSFPDNCNIVDATPTCISFNALYIYNHLTGNAVQTVQSNDPVKLVTVRGTSFPPLSSEGGNASEEKCQCFPTGITFYVTCM